uniref:Putative secreted protein n=1 Tax=Amblyomma cajennense TaxID=34607 RepID=A0A023FCM6_AMBCJ
MAMLRFATFSLALCLLAGLAAAENKDSKEPDSEQPLSKEPAQLPEPNGPGSSDSEAGNYEPTHPFPDGRNPWAWPPYYGPGGYPVPAPFAYNAYDSWGPYRWPRPLRSPYPFTSGFDYPSDDSRENLEKKKVDETSPGNE